MFALAGASFIAVISYLFYFSEVFREFLSGYYPVLNISVFLLLGLIFFRSIRRFNSYYESSGHSLKSIYLKALSLTLAFLFTLWFVDFDSQVQFHASFILLDIAILVTLPFLTAPFSIRENRAR